MQTDALYGRICSILEGIPGRLSVAVRWLDSGETLLLHEMLPFVAASVIKLPVMIAAFAAREAGTLDFSAPVPLRAEDKLPSCGVLKAMHDGLVPTVADLCHLMITVSDNTAANRMIRLVGIDAVNGCMAQYGARDSKLRRLLFDADASAKGIENTVTASDMLLLLQKLYAGEIVSPEASAEMLDILADQRLNGKMPFWLPPGTRCAHKTGEDDGITHDVGIVYAARPFAVCFLSQHTDPPRFIRAIQDITRLLYEQAEEGGSL